MPRPKKKIDAELSEEAQEKIFVKKDVEDENIEKTKSIGKKDEMVEVIVENLLNKGADIIGGYGPTDNHITYEYTHGFKYKMTRACAKHISELKVPKYENLPDGTGKVRKVHTGYIHRFSCKQTF